MNSVMVSDVGVKWGKVKGCEIKVVYVSDVLFV